MNLCKIKIFLIISITIPYGLSSNVFKSSSKLSLEPVILINAQQQQQQEQQQQQQQQQHQQLKQLQEQQLKQQLQQQQQQEQKYNNLSNIITPPFYTTSTLSSDTAAASTRNTTTNITLSAPITSTSIDNNHDDGDDNSDAVNDVNKLYVGNISRDSRSFYRQYFINNQQQQQQGHNSRPKDYSYNIFNNILNDANRYSTNIRVNMQSNEIGSSTAGNGLRNFPSTVDDCNTRSGNMGICMRRIECLRNGGSASGFCGTFGVCCLLSLKCNGSTKLKRTVIETPKNFLRYCTYHFQSYSTNVCQLRIDFEMILAQPTIAADNNNLQSVICLTDRFSVGEFVICGTNKNQHIYLPFDTANGITDISMTFELADRLNMPDLINPAWNMIVTQLECPSVIQTVAGTSPSTASSPKTLFDLKYQSYNEQQQQQQMTSNPILQRSIQHYTNLFDLKTFVLRPNYLTDYNLLAPSGCLQYFSDRQGTIESFNFNGGKGPYMSKMRYGICFKRTSLDTSIKFTAQKFSIGAALDSSNFIDIDCHDILGTKYRSNDHLIVPESILSSDPLIYGTFYCGDSVEATTLLYAPPGPFAIYFVSDEIYSDLVPEIGFKINYLIQ